MKQNKTKLLENYIYVESAADALEQIYYKV